MELIKMCYRSEYNLNDNKHLIFETKDGIYFIDDSEPIKIKEEIK